MEYLFSLSPSFPPPAVTLTGGGSDGRVKEGKGRKRMALLVLSSEQWCAPGRQREEGEEAFFSCSRYSGGLTCSCS